MDTPARKAARERYELKRAQDPGYKARKIEQQRRRRQREREAAQRYQAWLDAQPVEVRESLDGTLARREKELESRKAAARSRVLSYMSRNHIATMSCEDQRHHQRLGRLGCSYCGGRVRGFTLKDSEPFFACAGCGEAPACACCFRAS